MSLSVKWGILRDHFWFKVLPTKKYGGRFLPKWLFCIRCVLYPWAYLRYVIINRTDGYDYLLGRWKINGVSFNQDFFYDVSMSKGGIYSIMVDEKGNVSYDNFC